MEMDSSNWVTGEEGWNLFVQKNPRLGYPPGRWGFVNFLRSRRTRSDLITAREHLQNADVLRRARGRFWLVDSRRFPSVAFDIATGVVPESAKVNKSATTSQTVSDEETHALS